MLIHFSLGLAKPQVSDLRAGLTWSPQCPLVDMVMAVTQSFPELKFLGRSWLRITWAGHDCHMSPVPELPPCLAWMNAEGR